MMLPMCINISLRHPDLNVITLRLLQSLSLILHEPLWIWKRTEILRPLLFTVLFLIELVSRYSVIDLTWLDIYVINLLHPLFIVLMRKNMVLNLIFPDEDSARLASDHGGAAIKSLLQYWVGWISKLRIQVGLLVNWVRRVPKQSLGHCREVGLRLLNHFILLKFLFNSEGALRWHLFVTNLHMVLQNEHWKLLVALRAFVLSSLALVLQVVLITIEWYIVIALLARNHYRIGWLLSSIKSRYRLLRLLKAFLSD